MHTVVYYHQNEASYRSVGYLLIIPWPFLSGKTRQNSVYSPQLHTETVSRPIDENDAILTTICIEMANIKNILSTRHRLGTNVLKLLFFK